jgi:hypothetical protein
MSGAAPVPPATRGARRRWLMIFSVTAVVCVIAVVIVARYFPFSEKTVSESLLESFPGDLQFGRFQVVYFPHPGCVVEGVTFRLKSSASQVPPLITIQKLTIQGSYLNFLVRPHYLPRILLDGLRVYVPLPGEVGNSIAGQAVSEITIGEVFAHDAVLEVTRSDGKSPLEFDVRNLSLGSVSAKSGMSYRVAMHNPEPPGEIQSTGRIGPFPTGDLKSTPASGAYSFDHADLSVFNGIAGLLSSKGNFSGTLGNLHVQGDTDIPNFEVVHSKHALPLSTRFVVSVDATNGDVAINNLNATRGHTSIAVNGTVTHKDGWHGKFTTLDFAVRDGRIEDILPIFVTGRNHPSPLAGQTTLEAHVTVPPAGKPFLEELALDGDFDIGNGRLQKTKTKEKVDQFSVSAQGQRKSDSDKGPPDDPPADVTAQLSGHVVLRNAVATMSVAFGIPGADAHMRGTFNVINKKLDFHGTVRTDATLAQQTSGIKSVFAKVLDPLFKKKRGTVVPVVMDGTYRDPHFGLDLNPIKK